jgi:hypothetical protein
MGGRVVVIGRRWSLLSDFGRPRDGPGNGPGVSSAAYELMGNSRAR